MKIKNSIYIIILLFITLIGMWGVPTLVQKATYTPDQYPFVYYSSVLKELCLIDYKNKKFPMEDLKRNKYNTSQFDSLMPMLNYRQLMTEGTLPDSIGGYEITPQILRAKTVVYRFYPADIRMPVNGLYLLFETMPKRGGLEIPDDVFRMDNKIEFIDAQSNRVKAEKSELFRQALDKAGFQFPAKWLAGNPNPRKPYDEGYFVLDANNQLFHLKMVNDRPYVSNTRIGEQMDIAHFSMLEVADKRFYGFLFSKKGEMFIIENDGANYKTLQLGIDPIDLKQDQVILMGNLLDWTVSVVRPDGKMSYALQTESLARIGEHFIPRTPGKWDACSRWLFPVYLTFESQQSKYVQPVFHFTGWNGFIIQILLALIITIFVTNPPRKRIFNAVFLLLTGIPGLIAFLLLPDFKNK